LNRAEFIEQYTALAKQVQMLAEKARREGILSFDGLFEEERINERDILEYGLSFAVDGVAYEIIEKILSNIIAQEKDEYTRLYKTIQKEAVLAIQQGYNPKMIYFILNSFTDLPLKEDMACAETCNDDAGSEQAEPVPPFLFEDIAKLTDSAVQKILRETDSKDLAVALKVASEETQAKIFGNISKRATEMLKKDMEYMGPVRASDAMEAKQKMVDIIMQLADLCEIDISTAMAHEE